MTRPGSPISWPLRIWLFVEVLFGVLAVLSIGLTPASTPTSFAWPILPVVMAAVLGAFYMSSAPLFLFPLFARRWENIRVMILPATLFTVIELVATFLHWDKFSVGTLPFYVWFASYILPPPIFIALYWWQERKAVKLPASSLSPLHPALRWPLVFLGGYLTLGAIVVFIVPDLLIPLFPWKLTPLTARSLCGWLIAVGTLLLSMARENNGARVRLGTPMLMLITPALLLQMARYANEVNWLNPILWLALALFALIGLVALILAIGSWRDTLG
jgi:hypothetical protein